MGGAALRSAALSDSEVISLVNERFVPVWINVRTSAVPDVRRLDEVLIEASIDEHRKISNLVSLGFYLRSVVLTPDGETILNPQPSTMIGSGVHFLQNGHYAYAQTWKADYLPMLRDSLRRWQFLEDNRPIASATPPTR